MKHVSILVPKGQYSIVNIAGAFQILNWANDVYAQQTRQHLFKVEFVGHSRPAQDAEGFYTVTPPKTIEEVTKTDLIIVPAVHGDLREGIDKNAEVIEWVAKQYNQGAEIAAFCIGAFLLAETGILDGKTCSTHWGHAQDLQDMFPKVKVEAENIVSISDGIYTSGGAYAFTNLVIYLIERYGGRELALMTAKAFMIDVDKNNQSLYMIFNGQKNHGDEMVLKVQEHIEKHFKSPVSVAELADDRATNRRTLERRFKSATGNSVIQYLQRVRVERAKKILEQGSKSVTDAMFDSGYSDAKSFREVFRKYVGVSPLEYKRKFVKEDKKVDVTTY
ncbi:GlxA family transcriptional regulator [Marinoscillum pacificum]|uniref:GlxA family transcriptional regulator n=1 Tax=Marinoscillum pacificum TaxID=392723 RepID=UPI002156FAFB|nr:helix-turn-helix domain-containing protein [Marinoscillum pacificum]